MPRKRGSSPSPEYSLIKRLQPFMNFTPSSTYPLGVGDDAALRVCRSGEQLVFTADSQVEGIHFCTQYMSWKQIGYKAMAVNISDCAAMGARPEAALVQLFFPRGSGSIDPIVVSLYSGMREACKTWNFPIIGGDLASSASWSIAVTMIGKIAAGSRAVKRDGARPGDRVWVTGYPGMSAAGFHALTHCGTKQSLPSAFQTLAARHIRPQPRVEIGERLARNTKVHAMIDISDGVSKEVSILSHDSGVGIILEPASFPSTAALRRYAGSLKKDWVGWFLHGGEDYELLFCAAPDFVPPDDLAVAVSPIGEVSDAVCGVQLHGAEGLVPLVNSGWDHLPSSCVKN